VASFGTLLAAAGPCAQQDAADSQINLAKTLNSDPTMIKLSQIFAQQPRNSPSSQSVQYCQTAPKNSELKGLFQCQFQGVNPTVFVGGVAVGQPGTIPLGLSAPVSPPGSCPAHTSGPIADSTQLVNLTQDPGVPGGNNNAALANEKPKNGSPEKVPASSPAAPAATPVAAAAGGDFHRQNGLDAQKLNTKFASLTASSPCTAGESACVGTSFAQCVGGKFELTPCAASTTCVALPLVNKPGTSITCDTAADAAARFTASGVSGGISG
jgi:hypothetical protein